MSDMTKEYIINEDPIVVSVNIDPRDGKESLVDHKFRRPTFAEEETREIGMKIISEETGVKVAEGTSAPKVTIDDEQANIKFYNKLAISVQGKGYGLLEETPVTNMIGEMSVLDSIPNPHKITAVYGLMPSNFELDLGNEDEEYVLALGATREWKVKQLIGGQNIRDDGTLAPPNYTVRYIMGEPSEADRKKYRLNAMNNAPYIRKGGLRTDQQTVNLKVVADLFDRLVKSVENAVIEEKIAEMPEIAENPTRPIDVRNTEDLKLIPATFKKSVIIKLFNALEADLGKSKES